MFPASEAGASRTENVTTWLSKRHDKLLYRAHVYAVRCDKLQLNSRMWCDGLGATSFGTLVLVTSRVCDLAHYKPQLSRLGLPNGASIPLSPERLFSSWGLSACPPTGHASVRNGGSSTTHGDAMPHPRVTAPLVVSSMATRRESIYSISLVNEQDHGLAAMTLRRHEVVTGSITSMSRESA